MNQKAIALVPAYKPDSRIFDVVASLKSTGFHHILVVSDGNSAEFEPILSKLESENDVTLLRHSVNMGKGRALKTAFDYILKTWHGSPAVCVDCDGQLSAEDAAKGAELAFEYPDSLILGYRDLRHTKNVPFASRFGNSTTKLTVSLLTGLRFSDTQCGLRAYPPEIMKKLLSVPGERFEFENNTLLEVRKRNIPVVEFPINVVYQENEGYTTTFRRVRDSILIYKNLLSFLCAPAISYLLASVVWLLTTEMTTSPLWVGIAFAVSFAISAALCALASEKVRPLIISGIVLGAFLGGLALCLSLSGIGNGLVWLCMFVPSFCGLSFIFRRFGYCRRPKIVRLSK
ncbi:MAG: glycosyltransferase [Clostridia bacterium]|nr:glycosyltransferase [Clostridia bacterium]